MAVLPSQLRFRDACHRRRGIQSPVWALGSLQRMGASAETLGTLLRERYGVEEYVDFDLNGEAAVELDLSAPLPERWREGAGTVPEAGTLEHVFHVGRALENVHAMLRPGGTFLAIVPLTWWEHGFYNLNAKLLRAFAAANDYEPLGEAVWLRLRLPALGKRLVLLTIRDGAQPRTSSRLWLDRVMNRIQSANVLYLCCARKPASGLPARFPRRLRQGRWAGREPPPGRTRPYPYQSLQPPVSPL